MAYTIAVAGKGGVGKTTVCGMMIDALIKGGKGPLLVVDADANSNLNEVLGVEAGVSLGQIREEIAQAELRGDTIPKSMTKADYAEYRFESALAEEDDFDMLVMGRTQGKGCYCYVNGVLKTLLDKYIGAYRYVVIDNEAGMEHIARGTLPHVDALLLVSDCSFYLVAVPLAYLMLRSVPEEPTRKFGMTFGELFEWFLVSLAIVFVGGLLGNALAALFSGGMAQNRLDNIVGGIPAWLNILAVVVVGPIVEEWLCRKQIIARVRRYGERLAIVVSALVFALFHLNLYQFFYAFGLGLVLGYIYMRTSQLKYTIGLHMAINFLGSVVGPFFSDWSDAHSAALDAGDVSGPELVVGVAAMLYILLYLVAVVAGVVLLIVKCRRLEFYVTPAQLPKGTACSCAFVNAGMGVFITLTVFGMVLALMNVM